MSAVRVSVLAGAWAFVGCLELDREGAFGMGGDQPAGEGAEPASWIEVRDESDRGPVVAEPEDLAVCQAQARQLQRCAGDEAPSFDVEVCAERYACSRRLWRTDVPAVYRCLAERPCDDDDPVISCLEQVAVEVEPSEVETLFELELERAHTECAPLVEVAPRQADVIYDALSFCLTENDECDVKAACIDAMPTALVDRICGEG